MSEQEVDIIAIISHRTGTGYLWVSTAAGGTHPSLPPSVAFLPLGSVFFSTAYSCYQAEESLHQHLPHLSKILQLPRVVTY